MYNFHTHSIKEIYF